jgi:hypothetical protein
MKTKHLHLLLFFTLIFSPCWSQISGVVNLYVKVTAIQADCGHISVASSLGYNVGDRVILIQMKGASIISTNTATYGNITALNSAGGYEFNYIDAISGNDVYLKNTLTHTYDAANGCVQLIQVPVYIDVTVTGLVTALPWDGSVGGVVAMEVMGTLTLNAGISTTGMGFRGGGVSPMTYTACNATEYVLPASSTKAGGKGEGIAVTASGMESARGKQATGGGGGMSNNSGGGGGSNAGAGGPGGKETMPAFGCGNSNWGLGGLAMTYASGGSTVFLGGGGGGGHQNNLTGGGPATGQAGAAPGANGGGIIIIRADKIDGTFQTIEAKGLKPALRAMGDSGGGGGAGGSVLISYTTLLSGFSADVSGGNGGDVDADRTDRQLGAGGGGGGGVYWTNKTSLDPSITVNNAAGTKGIGGYYIWPAGIWTLYTPAQQTASDGAAGATVFSLAFNDATASCSPLPVSLLYFKAKQEGNNVILNWSTAWEKDNAGFIVQRSSDGLQFYTLNEIPSAACQQNCSYTYTDHNTNSGKVYYKLIQKDLDGTLTTIGSAIIEMNSNILAEMVYPQPASDVLHVELKDNLPVNVKLVDVTGREQIISYTQQDRLLILQLSVTPGLYTLWLNNQQYAETIKVVVQ